MVGSLSAHVAAVETFGRDLSSCYSVHCSLVVIVHSVVTVSHYLQDNQKCHVIDISIIHVKHDNVGHDQSQFKLRSRFKFRHVFNYRWLKAIKQRYTTSKTVVFSVMSVRQQVNCEGLVFDTSV